MDNWTRRKKIIAAALILVMRKKSKEQARKGRPWVKSPFLLNRHDYSHVRLIKELQLLPSDFLNYMKISMEAYGELLTMITPKIQKQDTNMRTSISPHERLSATLRFFASGISISDLQYPTAISASALGKIIPETCRAIINVLLREGYMKMPATEEDWKSIAVDFERKWHFPHCLGAVDGKHIRIQPPPDSGSFYYNYKGFHSVVLMACANANYEIVWCECGVNGRISDGGVIRKSKVYQKLEAGTLNIPDSEVVNGTTTTLPYVFIGDEAFALRSDFIKPYSQQALTDDRRIYNFRLSHAMRMIECIFGILVKRFKILQASIDLHPDKVNLIVMTLCILHNFLRRKSATYDEDDDDHEDMDSLTSLQMSATNHNPTRSAKQARDDFMHYFNGEGVVPWQYNRA